MSSSNSKSNESPPSMEEYFLKPLETVSFPKFPTLVELAEKPDQSIPERRSVGLFEGLLGDVGPLISDARSWPDKYPREALDLLFSIEAGQKTMETLTRDERLVLDRAVLDYSQAPRPPDVPPPLPKPPPREEPEEPEEDEERARGPKRGSAVRKGRDKRQGPIPDKDVPVTDLPPFWWLD